MDQELKKARNIGEENLADYAREGALSFLLSTPAVAQSET